MTDDPGTPSARETKIRIRRQARTALSGMPRSARRAADLSICRFLEELAAARGVRWVLGYLSLPDEVSLDALLAGLVGQGRKVWLPRVTDRHLRFGRWTPAARLSRDEEGVLAPAEAPSQEWPEAPGMILAPGRAFDRSGRRVGRGRGYYDRLLAVRPDRAVVVGVAYECQVVDVVPCEPHDRDVDVVVTERGTSFSAAVSNPGGVRGDE